MTATLAGLIAEHKESLVDAIVKDAIYEVPSYRKAPIRRTIARAERWLDTLADSIQRNEPDILERFLMSLADERREEGYVVEELHSIVHITERRLKETIDMACSDQVECNALLALLDAVMGAARMVLSVRYMMAGGSRPPSHGE